MAVLMPCRALEAFRLQSTTTTTMLPHPFVLMPCRALEAFRPTQEGGPPRPTQGLNALSGIGGVQTQSAARACKVYFLGLNALSGIGGVQTEFRGVRCRYGVGLNALSGIGGVQTPSHHRAPGISCPGLNALSGIGGVQTQKWGGKNQIFINQKVLMPCRALEAFRRRRSNRSLTAGNSVLMPCRALEAFRHIHKPKRQPRILTS